MRRRLTRYLSIAVASLVATVGLVAASPGTAQAADGFSVYFQTPCIGGYPPDNDPKTASVDYTFNYGGVTRAKFKGDYYFSNFYYAATGQPASSILDAPLSVDDRYADGYPPYFFLKVRFNNGTVATSPRYHDFQGAADPDEYCWYVIGEWTNKVITSVEMWISLDYIPSVPEYKIKTWTIPYFCYCP